MRPNPVPHTKLVLAILLIGVAPLRAGSQAPDQGPDFDGRWVVIGEDDPPSPRRFDDLCRYQGKLLAVGDFSADRRYSDSEQTTVYVWQDTCWVPLPGAPARVKRGGGGRGLLEVHGDDLLAVIGRHIYLKRGTSWQELAPLDSGVITDVAFWRGEPVIGGTFELSGEDVPRHVARWDGNIWRPVGGDVSGGAAPRVNALLVADGMLWVAGRFDRAGPRTVRNISAWDGRIWRLLDGGVDGVAQALVEHDRAVVVAGDFNHAGGKRCDGLARWRDLTWQLLPPLPIDQQATLEGEACPTSRFQSLARWSDSLVLAGDFEFVDARQQTARSIAMLRDGVWGALPGAADWFEPALTGPRNGRLERQYWQPNAMVGADDGLYVAVGVRINQPTNIKRLVDVFAFTDEKVRRLNHRHRRVRNEVTVHETETGSVVTGARYLGSTRVEGLGYMAGAGWQPIANWLTAEGISGGLVESVTTWRGDLVVAVSEPRLSSSRMWNVAQLHDGFWQSLGPPRADIREPVLATGSRDLLLFGHPHDSDWSSHGAWRFDGCEWHRVTSPPKTYGFHRGSVFSAAAAGTLWVAARHWIPAEFPGNYPTAADQGLYCLSDSIWQDLGAWQDFDVKHLTCWRGGLYAIARFPDRGVRRLVCWQGDRWHEVDHRNISRAVSQVVAAGDRLLLVNDFEFGDPLESATLAWDGASWEVWPGRDGYGEVFWDNGRLLKAGPYLAAWSGPLPPPNPPLLPPEPPAQIARTSPRFELDGLPELVANSASDSTLGWILYDNVWEGPPPKVEAKGEDGIRIRSTPPTKVNGGLVYRFVPDRNTWYRASCRMRKPERSVSASLSIDSCSHDIFGDKAGIRLDFLVPAPSTAEKGSLRLDVDGHDIEFTDLSLHADADLLANELALIWADVQRSWLPRPGSEPDLPHELPADLAAKAQQIFDREGADLLLQTMLERFGDPRVSTQPFPHSRREQRVFGEDEPSDPFTVPEDSLACEILPRGVVRWLAGDIGYCRPDLPSSINMSDAQQPALTEFSGKGLIVDLRRSSNNLVAASFGISYDSQVVRPLLPARTGELMRWLSWLGFSGQRWARQRWSIGKHSEWHEVDESAVAPAYPIFVLVSGQTAHDTALLAEALGRLDRVVLLGEETSPLPAIMEWRMLPWPSRTGGVYFPAGAWEDPGGRTLTNRTVVPDVAWPAADTEGLVARAREMIASGIDAP